MNYLNFDKTSLTNLEKSLTKEMIRTNRSGAYNSTTLVDCNTRKYHGQLVIPIEEIDDDNHVLLSSLDETIIQHKAEFNLGLHQYAGGTFYPNGHKYIREYSCQVISKTIYRVGGVIISKERMMVSFEPRIITKYTLLQAHSATTIRFKPFLAFRNVNALCKENNEADTSYTEVKNGISMRLYQPYPALYMQFSKKPKYVHAPHWNKNIEYYKEKERGYEYTEDLLVNGYFEMPIKKGESIYFTAGINEITPKNLADIWEKELSQRGEREDMFACLKNAANQFYKHNDKGDFLLTGYPWFHSRARDEFISLPGCTLCIGEEERFHKIMETAIAEINLFFADNKSKNITELDVPDALLWFVWAVQQYSYQNKQEAKARYAATVNQIVRYIIDGKHPNILLKDNALLYVNGETTPMTWMNAKEINTPIVPRTGFVVEINALWYNTLCFAAEITEEMGKKDLIDMANKAKESFVDTFWNGFYLYDYVSDDDKNVEVRPNMIYAVALEHSPLDKFQQKAVVDICTRELLTTKGLRSLSPKSGFYRPNYVGSMKERNWNYHNGPVWPFLTASYIEAYLKLHKRSGLSFVDRLIVGMEAEMKKLCVGTLSELFDGNPPYNGHGAMSYAPTVAEILRSLSIIKQYEEENN